MLGFHVGGNANFKICLRAKANFSVFRYQHVGIPNAKFHVGGPPTHGPNANVFALQWNIGFSVIRSLCFSYADGGGSIKFVLP